MTAISFLGLGRMGLPMAENLAKAGFDLTVWNRTPAKATEFAATHGGTAVATPAEAARAADVVISMLTDDSALHGIYEGPEGILQTLRPGTVAIDMSTVAPATVAEIAAAVQGAGGTFLDAPVSGSTAAATAAALTIMVGGPAAALATAEPVLSAMGKAVIHLGDTGAGSTMKLAVNSIVHSLNGAVSEALVLAERAGIERTAAYSVFLNSAIAAPFVQYRQATFERPDDVPVAFRLTLAAKDLRLALALAKQVGASLPQAQANLTVLEQAAEAGLADRDESAVAVYLRDHQR